MSVGLARLHPRRIRAGMKKRYRSLTERSTAYWYAQALAVRAARSIGAGATKAIDETEPGVTLAGYFEGSLGLGESVRLLGKILDASSVPHAFVSMPTNRDTQEAGVPLGDEFAQPITIVHVSPFETFAFLHRFGRAAFAGKKIVALWYWELEEIPVELRAASLVFDEVWVASRWLADACAPALHCPVRVFPFPLDVLERVDPKAGSLPLPIPDDRFVFLTAFDHHSSYERKNPEATVRAYLEAFPRPSARAMLVLKSLHADAAPEKHAHLVALCAERPDIVLFDRDLPEAAMDALFARADCFVSLHRSEGLGLGFLHAVMNGKEAIVTGYSAPSEFAGLPGLHLVGYALVPVATDYPAYRGRGSWAEPDIAEAATTMQRLASADRPTATRRTAPSAHTRDAFLEFVRARGRELVASPR